MDFVLELVRHGGNGTMLLLVAGLLIFTQS